MKKKECRINSLDELSYAFPAKFEICSTLGINILSTQEEILHAYEDQMRILNSLVSNDEVEQKLLENKKEKLFDIYKKYEDEIQKSGPLKFQTAVNAAKQAKQRGNTLYSFHIPCIFWCLFKLADCVTNCFCSCCGCDSGECWSECYNEGGECDCLQTVDTLIAIAGLIAGLVFVIKKIGPVVSEAAANKAQRSADRKKQKLVNDFRKLYMPKLIRAYDEWESLRKYTTDVRGFLRRVSANKIQNHFDSDFTQMQEKIETEYKDIEVRWDKLQGLLAELRSERNGEYYEYLRSEAAERAKYSVMFSSNKQPWHN